MTLLVNQQIALGLFDAARLLREAFEHAHRDMKITWPQIRIMGRLYVQEGIAQSEIGAQLEMDPMTISRQIDRLVDLGFVERRTEQRDRRLRKLYLTRHSRILREDIEKRTQSVLNTALHGFDAERQASFLEMLKTFADNLCEPGSDGTPSRSRTKFRAANEA
ncbi:transcriptional regulator, MarR family protein [Fulvimarina pelagi HTCC2506]|uniref:Transcriptional regulator, MarR family protein n=1 Tax=Fulvimarina pelagi HTCC2506 TaxID=314231 RepID=Q0G3J3_9HYPH|nr:MarR family transcriptional regulator [Fulvimarina pelagi]EAU41838.1 transcriptional regulator, MarR family protein [Fulvimarina pelagi HTCC2506]